MCAVIGYWDFSGQSDPEQLVNVVSKMRDTMIHRGPDGAGSWVTAADGVALGHRRLAIVDLSEHGAQPMQSASGRYVISYNGEIYNHLEIKQQLMAANLAPNWQGHSDTEIILAAFEAWGITAALEKFVGMFAIVLWDTREKLLYLIRDRMGEKPLYYGWCDKYFLFGSELKGLQAHFAWQQDIDPNAVSLLLRYNCIPAPYTIYRNIKKLEPGHMLIVNRDKAVQDIAYWQLKDVINTGLVADLSESEATNQLESKLKQAVKLQMLADVPVGAFLSGGIDSSTIVALMQAQSSTPVKTFTIGFEADAYNEAEFAKAVAQHLHTQHTELYLSAAQTRSIIPDLANFYDEPFADSSQLPTYIVAKLTREHVTVSLSGDGGDELFGGYNRYTWVPRIWQKIAYLPRPVRAIVAKLLILLPPKHWDKVFSFCSPLLPGSLRQPNPGDKVHKLTRLLNSASPYEIYEKLLSHWDMPTQGLLHNLTQDLPAQSLTATMMYVDSQRYLPDDILVKVDRAAMAVSLETRMPFLDHRVVEFAWSLPENLKMRNGTNKWLLRQVLHRYVPQELFERPKMGFAVPVEQWLRGPLQEWAQDLLSSSMLSKHGLLDVAAVQKKWREHLSGTRNWQYHLWDVLMFQSWYEKQYG